MCQATGVKHQLYLRHSSTSFGIQLLIMNASPVVSFVPGQRGSQNAVVDGYRYTKNGSRKEKTYYRCVAQPTCGARITLTSGVLTSPLPDHNHPSQQSEIAVLVAKNTIKTKAATTTIKTHEIVTEAVGSLDLETKSKLNCQISSLERTCRRARSNLLQPPSPHPPSPTPSPPPALPRRSGRVQSSLLIALEKTELEDKIRCGYEDGLEVLVTADKGRGLYTTEERNKGDFLVEYRGKLLSRGDGLCREQQLEGTDEGCYLFFFPFKEENYCLDATEEDETKGRLINHSRSGNSSPKTIELDGRPRLYFVASRTISRGEEILYDYGDRRAAIISANRWLGC